MWFYGDEATRALINGDRPIVYLYGGYEGFDNFGDILQLKSTIAFHRQRTGRTPVVVLSLAAWTSPGLLDSLKSQFDVGGFIFEDGELLDASSVGLAPITDVTAGALLHIYGGGYFNRFWGARRAYVCEQLMFRLRTNEYVVSGVQVDSEGADHLTRLFALKAPLAIGARDKPSVELLAAVSGATVHPTFDDAMETIDALRDRIAALGGTEHQGQHSFGLHMNTTSEYMSPEQGEVVAQTVATVRSREPHLAPLLLQAYNDRRHVIDDTIETAQKLGTFFLEPEYRVINLAAIAADPHWSDSTIRRFVFALAGIDFVISSSYHVSLTMTILGIPSYLVSSNDFYAAKREALSLPATLEAFLTDPRSTLQDYAVERRQRVDWLELLATTINTTESLSWTERAVVSNPPESVPVASVAERYAIP
jgi:hypothetical protein